MALLEGIGYRRYLLTAGLATLLATAALICAALLNTPTYATQTLPHNLPAQSGSKLTASLSSVPEALQPRSVSQSSEGAAMTSAETTALAGIVTTTEYEPLANITVTLYTFAETTQS